MFIVQTKQSNWEKWHLRNKIDELLESSKMGFALFD